MSEECTLELGPGGQARLGGRLTFETCTRLYHSMEKQLESGETVKQIDLSTVSEVDSAGLALLLEWQAVSKLSGNSLVLTSAPDSLLQLAKLCLAVELLELSGRDVS